MSNQTHACIRISTHAVALAAGTQDQIVVAIWPKDLPAHFLMRLDALDSAYPLERLAVVDKRCKGHAVWRAALTQWCESRGILLEFPDGRRAVAEFADSGDALAEATKRGILVRHECEAEAVALLDYQFRRAAPVRLAAA